MGSARPPIEHPGRSAGDDLAATLASAFATDPLMNFLLPGAKRLSGAVIERRLAAMFRRFVHAELVKPHHLVQAVGGGMGVAVWHEVDDWKTPPRQLVRSAPNAFRTFGHRLPLALRLFDQVERAHPREPHRYLAFLGVHADHKGRGLGSALLQTMTEECDAQGLPAYLENSNPANTPLYARYGFESRGPLSLPGGAPELLAMWRDPR